MTMSRKAKALQFADEGYNIQITGRHVQITDAMKNYAIEKVSKIERFTDRIIDVIVILDIQKHEHRAEIILKTGFVKITGQAVTDDMYASIDKAVQRIETQLRRYKKRLQDHHIRTPSAVDMLVNVIRVSRAEEESAVEEFDHEINNILKPHEVVKQEARPLKMLTLDEAVMKMELSGDAFLIFKSQEDQKLKVIYRRKDGDYGIIEPQC